MLSAVFVPKRGSRAGAQVYGDSQGGKGGTLERFLTTLNDPKNVIPMVPQNTFKYAQFMQRIGSLRNRPVSWKDLFFPDVHDLPGN